MTVKVNTFEQLSCCPFCGNDEFYITNWMQGSCDFNMRFDGDDAADNSQMYDGLIVAEGKRAYYIVMPVLNILVTVKQVLLAQE